MKVTVNGEDKQFSDEMSLSELVSIYKLENKLVVAEVNGEVIDRSEWNEMLIKDGMSIELVHFVGGG